MGKQQKKKPHHSKPHGNGVSYAELQKAKKQALVQASADTYTQFLADLACIVLHDEFGFGAERCRRFHAALQESRKEWDGALDGECAEAGYLQSKLDARLDEIGVLDVPWEARYEWLKGVV